MTGFAQKVIAWQKQHGRHTLPWQCEDPYRIWLSEIMLQQTQVATVIPYFERFIARFPTVKSLAEADLDDVLALWAGLGYYARARNLHFAANQIMTQFAGKFPQTRAQLETLKGVGRSTAAAIAVFAFGKREAICDGNVRRVFARHQCLAGDLQKTDRQAALWQLAEARLPKKSADLQRYTQGLMDLGSTICTRSRPDCPACPVRTDCLAYGAGLQSEYPQKKKAKPKPQKDGWFLLCQTKENAVLLEKRPTNGIWGGLWCLPGFPDRESLLQFVREKRYELRSLARDPAIPVMRHTFSHYHLWIHLYEATGRQTEEGFYPRAQALSSMALPSPVLTILQSSVDRP